MKMMKISSYILSSCNYFALLLHLYCNIVIGKEEHNSENFILKKNPNKTSNLIYAKGSQMRYTLF